MTPATASAPPAPTAPSAGPTHECGVCWYAYDPGAGDPVWQVPAGTAFTALPAHWSCPVCDASRERFLEIGRDRRA